MHLFCKGVGGGARTTGQLENLCLLHSLQLTANVRTATVPLPPPPALSSPLSYLLSPFLAHSQLIAEHFIWPPNRYLRSDHKYFPALISMRLHCCLSPMKIFALILFWAWQGRQVIAYFLGGRRNRKQSMLQLAMLMCRLLHASACLCVHVRACLCLHNSSH